MQQNYRELGLHSIIKSQEAKIHELRQQLKIANQREEVRYQQFSKGHQYVIDDKQKIITKLKSELNSANFSKTQQIINLTNKFQSQRSELQSEIIRQRNKAVDLQKKIIRLQYESQIKIKQLNSINRKILTDLNQKIRVKNVLTSELYNLNLFYKKSLTELPKRKEVVVGINNVIKYLQKNQQNNSKDIKSLYSFVKTSLESIRSELINLVQKNSKNQAKYQDQLKKIAKEIKQLSSLSTEAQSKVIKQNQHFWEELKTQNNILKQQEVAHLERQITKWQKLYHKDVDQLKNNVKMVEMQKKTLLIGFQQLKTVFQQKEKTYREEINLLKANIQEIISISEERQVEFQNQIKNLENQLNSITKQYQQKIQHPIRINGQILQNTVEKARLQFSKIIENPIMNKNIDTLSNNIQSFISGSKPQKYNQLLLKYIGVSQSSIQSISQSVEKMQQKIQTLFQPSVGKNRQLQLGIQILQMKQKQNKIIYELNISQKHNIRLLEYCSDLQKKLTNKSSKNNDNNLKKTQFLQKNKDKQISTQQDRQKRQQHIKQFNDQILVLKNQTISIKNNVQQILTCSKDLLKMINFLKLTNDDILHIIKQLGKKVSNIQDYLIGLKKVFQRPVQTIESLVKQNSQNNITFSPVLMTERTIRKNNNESHLSSIVAYKNITTRRNQATNNINKNVNELIKVIRQSFTKPKLEVSQINQKSPQKQNQYSKISNVLKKMKQSDQKRLKDHKKIIQCFQRINEIVNIIQSKLNVKQPNNSSQQIEVILDKKIRQLMKQINQKPQININQTIKEALLDVQNKFKQILQQNEGLIKQINLLKMTQQSQ